MAQEVQEIKSRWDAMETEPADEAAEAAVAMAEAVEEAIAVPMAHRAMKPRHPQECQN